MANRKNRVDDLHDQLPAIFDTRNNDVWSAVVDALGEADQETLDLIENVRKQFFVNTASRPYLDRLGAASSVQRPRFVGMQDTDFRKFIPVMSYQPKQVKLVLDNLLDLFFFKESTTSFVQSELAEPFNLSNGWELEYEVDSTYTEYIEFEDADFTNINNAKADEVVAVINRQASNSYAVAYNNALTSDTSIRIFSNIIGSKGSVKVTGGRANIALHFNGWNNEAGQGTNTEWNIVKVGDTVTMKYTGNGGSPNIEALQDGDVVVITRQGNEGSFTINSVDPIKNEIAFNNLFATEETFSESSAETVKFFTPLNTNLYLRDRKAAIWEVQRGEIIAEMPPTPPVVKRDRVGAAHINGLESDTTNIVDKNTLEVEDAGDWPQSGRFYLVPHNEIHTYFPSSGNTDIYEFNNRLESSLTVYTYSSKSGNTLEGIQPSLPDTAGLFQVGIVTANRDSNNTITVKTSSTHNFKVDDTVIISNAAQGAGTGISTNGSWVVTEIVSDTEFKVYSFSGPSGSKQSSGGTARVERIGLANTGSRVILTTSQLQPEREGPYLWNQNSDFVLSSYSADLTKQIKAGNTERNIQVTQNQIPDKEGKLIFDFGTEKQEGPVRYFFKPNSTSISIDPSYVFEHTHSVGSSVTMIRRRGGVRFSGFGDEHAPYITDPTAAREVLQELMQEVKSVGIFINFLIRYPEFFYATIDTYNSGVDP